MKILVCGGRDYTDEERVREVLSEFAPDTIVVHGSAKGADSLADKVARELGMPSRPYPADWDAYGLAAGPKRNQEMLDKEKPDLVIAFPGGTGTRDMVNRSKRQGFKVRKVTPPW